jgi:hypothetical protein
MDYKRALAPKTDFSTEEKKQGRTLLQPVIKYGKWEGKPGWIKIYSVIEPVLLYPENRRSGSRRNEKDGVYLETDEEEIKNISLEGFVKLQERRMAEYDADRWEGAFRELYPIYPPYPEEVYDPDTDEITDGQYMSDMDGYYYSDPEY